MTHCQLPAAIFGNAFRAVPGAVTSDDVSTGQALVESLLRIVRSPEGKKNGHAIAVWALDTPYTHQDGRKRPSCVTYIEKVAECLAYRWSRSHLLNFGTDEGNRGELENPGCLRQLAQLDYNFTFYSQLIRRHGPLRIWLATVDELNAAGDRVFASHREWEQHLNLAYLEEYGCLPLKNRQP